MGVMDTLTRSTAHTVAKTDAKKWAMDRSEALRVVFHALDGDDSMSRLLQISHGRPAAHRGIASWRLGDDTSVVRELRGAGWGFESGGRPKRPNKDRLMALDFRWALVETGTGEVPDGLGESTACGAYSLHRLGP